MSVGEPDIRMRYEDGEDVVGISSIVGMVLGIIIFIIIATGDTILSLCLDMKTRVGVRPYL
jgi:hypothetical protein